MAPWLSEPRLASRLDWLSAVAGLDLTYYGTQADTDQIRDTAVAQPLLVAAGLVTALELFPRPADAFDVVGVAAGHSVGELTAAAGAGVLSAEQAMVLVRERGRAMAEASAAAPTSMRAAVGGDPDQVLDALGRHGLTPANHNGAGQIVAAGTVEQLDALAGDLPRRVRLVPLSVAGAFHTHHMAAAVDRLARLAGAVSAYDPRLRLISNADGRVVHDGQEVLNRIIGQIASPVRWDLCMETMGDLGVTGMLELPPAGTLTGLAKRNLPDVELFSLNTPDQLTAAAEFVSRHGEPTLHDLVVNPPWRVVVSPGKGHFTKNTEIKEDVMLTPATHVGQIANLRDRIDVSTTHGGVVLEWLVEDGDPVSPGQPLLRLHPELEDADAGVGSR